MGGGGKGGGSSESSKNYAREQKLEICSEVVVTGSRTERARPGWVLEQHSRAVIPDTL